MPNQRNSIVAFLGANHGVGCSTLAATLGQELSRDLSAMQVCVVERVGAEQAGGPAQRIPLQNLRPRLARLNELHRFLNATGGTGPVTVGLDDRDSAIDLCSFLDRVSPLFDLVVVDALDVLEAPTALLDRIRSFVVVTAPEVESVDGARKLLERLRQRTIPTDRIALVVNGVRPGHVITVEQIGASLGRPVTAKIVAAAGSAVGDDGRLTDVELRRGIRRLAVALLASTETTVPNNQDPIAARATIVTPAACVADLESAAAAAVRYADLKEQVLDELRRLIDLKRSDLDGQEREQARIEIGRDVRAALDLQPAAPSRIQLRELLVEQILDEALGWGPLEPFLRDPSVQDIMVNGLAGIFVERGGRKERTPIRFTSARQLQRVVDRILAPLGRQVNESVPYVDARLPQGYRVNIVVGPLAVGGTAITIRKFPERRLREADLLAAGCFNRNMRDFLHAAIVDGMNMLIVGGTGSGKTTLLTILADAIPDARRVVTIEDTLELAIAKSNLVQLEARPANVEGAGEIAIRQLVKNALRMSPDVIVIGEMRGAEAFDALQAMNSGHQSLGTVHANSIRDCLSRVESLVHQGGLGLPSQAIRESMFAAIDLIIHVVKEDGERRIVEIAGMRELAGNELVLETVFRYRRGRASGAGDFTSSGRSPSWLRRAGRALAALPRETFWV